MSFWTGLLLFGLGIVAGFSIVKFYQSMKEGKNDNASGDSVGSDSNTEISDGTDNQVVVESRTESQ